MCSISHGTNTDQTGLHVLLGFFLCIPRARAGCHFPYIVPCWLVVCAGIWSGGSVYYFSSHVANQQASGWLRDDADPALLSAWLKVGCAMAALSA